MKSGGGGGGSRLSSLVKNNKIKKLPDVRKQLSNLSLNKNVRLTSTGGTPQQPASVAAATAAKHQSVVVTPKQSSVVATPKRSIAAAPQQHQPIAADQPTDGGLMMHSSESSHSGRSVDINKPQSLMSVGSQKIDLDSNEINKPTAIPSTTNTTLMMSKAQQNRPKSAKVSYFCVKKKSEKSK